MGKIQGFLTARAAYMDTNPTKKRMVKDESKEAGKRAMRDFANTSICYNNLMLAQDKMVYGLQPLVHTRPPIGEPDSYPEVEANTLILKGLFGGIYSAIIP